MFFDGGIIQAERRPETEGVDIEALEGMIDLVARLIAERSLREDEDGSF